METKVKGRTTLRIAAVCFLASAVFEILDVLAPVPLLGAIRSGVAAMGYHLLFTAIFLAMGIGLWAGKPGGYGVVMAGTRFTRSTRRRCFSRARHFPTTSCSSSRPQPRGRF